jgi:hypothetical protein
VASRDGRTRHTAVGMAAVVVLAGTAVTAGGRAGTTSLGWPEFAGCCGVKK